MACQYLIQGDIVVTIPSASRLFEQKILTAGIETQTKIKPDIYIKYQSTKWDILGVAVDIGTTTVVTKLLDMKNGKCLATEAKLNPQIQYGDDVISRIAYAQNEEKAGELRKAIIDCVNKMIVKLCRQIDADPQQIYEVAIAGNTTMNHLFLGLPVAQLGQAPYKAFSVEAYDIPPGKSGLNINPDGNVHTIENIAGFVGADTVAVALATNIGSVKETTLIVDIGTNGEIVLAVGEELLAASCAAGPALEGARISCGSRAGRGAIEAVVVNADDIDFDVIGGAAAHSICGSGLIDAVAVLLELGVIDNTGCFVKVENLKGKLHPKIISRIIEKDDQPAFLLAQSGKNKVILTQRDIRQMQLAKAAIRTGIKLLQKKTCLTDSDIKCVLLAGAFGNYIRRESAMRIGLLPNVPVERIHFIGNAALSGAEMILLSRQARIHAGKLARKIRYVEIAHEPDFTTVYADCMLF